MGCLKQSNETITLFDLSSSHVYDPAWLTLGPVATKPGSCAIAAAVIPDFLSLAFSTGGLVLLDLIIQNLLAVPVMLHFQIFSWQELLGPEVTFTLVS